MQSVENNANFQVKQIKNAAPIVIIANIYTANIYTARLNSTKQISPLLECI